MEILIKSFNGRNDKNDVLLQELINAKNWKQALTSCEKRIKKGEKSDVLLVRLFINPRRVVEDTNGISLGQQSSYPDQFS